MSYSAAVIGTGPDPETQTMESFAMGYLHADGFVAHDAVDLVACADIVRENAAAFADEYDIADEHIFEDYERMLDALEVDIVSIAVPPALHADIVIDCAESGVVDAIHCEKPMDLTWGGATDIAAVAEATGVQITFNHQRRFGKPFTRSKELLDSGEIGALQRIELGGLNLYDFGSHTFDMASMYVDQSRPAWVLGAIDYREEQQFFGAHNENHASATWAYENGVHGTISTGVGGDCFDGLVHLVGSAGELTIDNQQESVLRCRVDGDGWRAIDVDGEDTNGPSDEDAAPYVTRAIANVVDCLDEGRPSPLRAENALQSTALIFGAWESARRRGRVDDPMTMEIRDNPLEAMVKSGALTPEPAED
jgi:predicted dehydrogenase